MYLTQRKKKSGREIFRANCTRKKEKEKDDDDDNDNDDDHDGDDERHEETYTTDYHVSNDSVSAMSAKLKNTVRNTMGKNAPNKTNMKFKRHMHE